MTAFDRQHAGYNTFFSFAGANHSLRWVWFSLPWRKSAAQGKRRHKNVIQMA
jgi:hypothetical protein